MYLPYRQADAVLPVFQLSVVLRTSMDPLTESSSLRTALAEIDSNQPLVNVRTMEDNISGSVAQPRFRTWLLGIFAVVALVLAAVGIYGVMSYSVNQRTGEIGVRMALGAEAVDVFRLIVGQGLWLALIGVSIGLLIAAGLTRVLRTFLFGVSALDPVTFLSMGIALTSVSLAASYIPARRATKVDPMVALREE
jgi:putative ABC transport system permease protein